MTRRSAPRRAPARAIRAILVLQIAIAGVLFARDIAATLPDLGLAPPAPALTAPVRPGDQTRRYDRHLAPARPAQPGGDLPPRRELPERLQFRLSGQTIALSGDIAPGDSDRFSDWLEQAGLPPGTSVTVTLDSPGGSVGDALAIGRAIRAAGFATRIGAGAVCLSACPYILAGGTGRSVDPEGHVGVHQHYFGESTVLPAGLAVSDIQRGQGEVLEYLGEMGIDPMLMRHSLATPPDRIYILLADELEAYGLVTPPEG